MEISKTKLRRPRRLTFIYKKLGENQILMDDLHDKVKMFCMTRVRLDQTLKYCMQYLSVYVFQSHLL